MSNEPLNIQDYKEMASALSWLLAKSYPTTVTRAAMPLMAEDLFRFVLDSMPAGTHTSGQIVRQFVVSTEDYETTSELCKIVQGVRHTIITLPTTINLQEWDVSERYNLRFMKGADTLGTLGLNRKDSYE